MITLGHCGSGKILTSGNESEEVEVKKVKLLRFRVRGLTKEVRGQRKEQTTEDTGR